MIDHIPELIAAGIDSFKIEGRNKTAYYAAGITSAYRRAVDAYTAAPQDFVLPADIHDEIGKISHRNYYTGFYFGADEIGQYYEDSQYIRDWEVVGLYQHDAADGRPLFNLKNRIYPGDTLELLRPGCEPFVFKADRITDEEGTLLEVAHHPEMLFSVELPFKVDEFSILRQETKKKD